ncbi:MAG: hypothetical protein JWP93_370 [Polaromonas sp.]|nr:hypothetical protein [Polaromonas sp.]
MTRARKWLPGAGIFAGVLALLALVAVRLIPSDEELARRAADELETALGVPVTIGALHWRLLPSPSVVIEDAATGQPQPIEIKRLTAWLDTSALWQRRLKVERAQLAGAVLPQLSLRGLGRQPANSGPEEAKTFTLDGVPLARIEFRDVTWVSRRGIRLVYDGEADFDAGWRPRTAALRRPGTNPPAEVALARQGQDDRWEVRSTVGGGTAHGEVQLHTGADGGLRLAGKLQPRDIDIASALQAFNRRSMVEGKISGDTTLSASGARLGQIAQSLHTATKFTVGPATLLRFDVDKAIRSLGREHEGSTPLDAISGQIDTQNTPKGMVVTYTGLKTRSGALSATGQARVANRQIDAELAVDLVDGIVGVPLTLSGPVDKVRVSVPPSALAGAAVGTAVLPGIGTAIGARIGSAIGRLLGPEPEGKRRLAPVEK